MPKSIVAELKPVASRWIPTRRKALWLSFWYAVLSTLWIVGSGRLLHYFVPNEPWGPFLEHAKAGLFVLVTAVLLALVLDRHFRTLRRSVQQIQESETRLHLMRDNLPDCFVYQYTRDAQGLPRFFYVSAGVERVHGLAVAEVLSDANSLLSQIDPAQVAAYAAAERESARTLTKFEMELRMHRPDGQVRTILARSMPRRNEAGQVQWDGFVQDITEFKQAVEALQQSEQNYREIFNATNEAIFLHDAATGQVLDVNDAVLRLHGYDTKEELLAGEFRNLLANEPPYSWEEAQKRMRLAIEQGPQVFEWLNRKRTGERFWVEVSLRTSHIGQQRRVLAVVRDITERKQAEQALREREQQFQIFVEHSPAAIAMLDRHMRYLVTSQRWLSNYRLGERSIIGRSHYEVFPEIPERWKEIHQRCLAGAIERSDADAFPRADGSTDWVRWEIRPWRTAQGEVGGLIIFSEVITQSKQAEEALRQSEETFRTTFELASIGMAQTDPRTAQFLRVNRKMCEITGYAPEELLQKKVAEITHPDDRQQDGELFQRVIRDEVPNYRVEKRYLRKHGSVAWVNVNMSVIRDAAGRPVRTMATIEDITERKRSEQQLRLQSAALEAAANAIVITDREGRIEWANPAFATFTGYTAAEVIGKHTRLLKSGKQDQAFYQDLWNTVLAGKIWRREMVTRRKDGSFYEEEMTITPVRDPRGTIAHFVAIRQDITERKRLQAQFHQSQKMEAIGQLAGGVAHDFNNILAAMMMQAELASMTPDLPGDVREGLQQIRASAERAANLTRQLLLFSRKQVMQPRELDLNEVVTSLAKMLQRIIGEDVRLQLHLHPAPLLTHADAGMLDQTLMNLAVNARDAMPQGGQLVIETSETTLDAASAQVHPEATPGRFVCLSVSDSGCGIPPEVLPRIFEPFFTTKEVGKGTGLGLATVFGIARQHHGWIQVHSQPGQGATFQVFLPASRAVVAEGKAVASPKPRGGTETILLAEDDPRVRLTTRTLLETFGYTVLEAADGAEALQTWQQHQATVALLLTDLVMPGDISGRQLARELHQYKPTLKVIYTSGYSAEIAGRGIELQPGENFIQKPYSLEQLLNSIRRSLDS